MPMAKRKLKAGKPKVVRKTSTEKLSQKKEARENRVDTKQYNKTYYQKNKKTILKRAAERRKRSAKGDTRTTRRVAKK